MNWGDLFVTIGIFLDIAALLGYGVQREWNKSLYWFGCALVMIAIRRMK